MLFRTGFMYLFPLAQAQSPFLQAWLPPALCSPHVRHAGQYLCNFLLTGFIALGALVVVAPLSNATVDNTTSDTTAPTTSSAMVNGATLTLTFSETLDQNARPPRNAFAVAVGDIDVNVASGGVELSDATVTHGQTVTVSYTKPMAERRQLKDEAGNTVADFTGQVRNNTPAVTTSPVTVTSLNRIGRVWVL